MDNRSDINNKVEKKNIINRKEFIQTENEII